MISILQLHFFIQSSHVWLLSSVRTYVLRPGRMRVCIGWTNFILNHWCKVGGETANRTGGREPAPCVYCAGWWVKWMKSCCVETQWSQNVPDRKTQLEVSGRSHGAQQRHCCGSTVTAWTRSDRYVELHWPLLDKHWNVLKDAAIRCWSETPVQPSVLFLMLSQHCDEFENV